MIKSLDIARSKRGAFNLPANSDFSFETVHYFAVEAESLHFDLKNTHFLTARV